MSISLATIENAIHAWVADGSGLGVTKVIWANQDAPRPATPYIALRAELTPIGIDAVSVEDADTPSAGAEITYYARGMREMQIYMQCFGGSHRGVTSPHGYLELVHSSSYLKVRRQALRAAGIGIARRSSITSIGGVMGSSQFEPRGLYDVVGFVASEATEDGTFIEVVGITNTGLTGDFTVDSTP